ncbi:helix-turn-helix domain-containing protein [Streptomyces sp. NBC_00658]|uniref:winged helix-turn-helix domain-containing protein n=1 Tax=Streptomyces sp. NBC_00658 TaxID=2975800 RepID=UPI0038708DD7
MRTALRELPALADRSRRPPTPGVPQTWWPARPGRVLTREWLLKSLWGEQGGPTSNTVDVYVMYLRRKLEAGGYFLSVPGAGMWVPCSLSLSVGTAGL